ncbi:basic salivary proline-rich protein 3-like [Cyprinodon tularosa]|uniref:basic salivary proline-rich protein 3-like n=1 Tax=Cyprinodon tularosa TaxID=77115 RepID=UPI0018E285B0|nr:basic salivary proline-rich protein 3-like [Cyprinodon tularosa]
MKPHHASPGHPPQQSEATPRPGGHSKGPPGTPGQPPPQQTHTNPGPQADPPTPPRTTQPKASPHGQPPKPGTGEKKRGRPHAPESEAPRGRTTKETHSRGAQPQTQTAAQPPRPVAHVRPKGEPPKKGNRDAGAAAGAPPRAPRPRPGGQQFFPRGKPARTPLSQHPPQPPRTQKPPNYPPAPQDPPPSPPLSLRYGGPIKRGPREIPGRWGGRFLGPKLI